MKLVNLAKEGEKPKYINVDQVRLVKQTHLNEVMIVVGNLPLKSPWDIDTTVKELTK